MSYDPNPYDDKPLNVALDELFDRYSSRTVRQAIFAMAEARPVTFDEKEIVEDGTYAAADDGVSGYSTVVVNTGGGLNAWTKVSVVSGNNSVSVYNNEAEIECTTENNLYGTFANPLKKWVDKTSYPSLTVIFVPADDYEGLFMSNGTTKYSFTGDTVTPGDGYQYIAEINKMGDSYTMTKTNNRDMVGNVVTIV